MSEAIRWWEGVAEDLENRRTVQRYRRRRTFRHLDATHVELDGRRLINFSSNNYLGLTHHPKVLAAAEQAISREGFGSASAPLICGYGPAQESAERSIASWKGTEQAVLLPSGYQANLAAVQTAAAIGQLGNGVRFLIDKLAHASLIDAIRGSGEPFRIFPHNHLHKLRRLLQEAPEGQLQVVVTESIFSMDGDAAALVELAQLKDQHPFLLILDEAHATGVYGQTGSGLAAELGLESIVDVKVLTLSKALGGIGGAVCASATFCDALINYARAYLFSTGIPASVAAAAEAAVEASKQEPERRNRVRAFATKVRQQLAAKGFTIPAGDSPIIPIIVGDDQSAVMLADQLLAKGLLVAPVRPPTVPLNGSRLRITLSSEHTEAELDTLILALSRLASTLTLSGSDSPSSAVESEQD